METGRFKKLNHNPDFTENEHNAKSIAESLEMDSGLLPFVPDLLKDLWAMGCSPELVMPVLTKREVVGLKTNGLDLGCGKGAMCVTLAKELNIQMTGVDAFEPFLEIARKKASEHQVHHLCNFNHADIRQYVKEDRHFDFVTYAALGSVLGNFQDIVAALRSMVKQDCIMFIDDGYLKSGQSLDRSGYNHYTNHQETLARLKAHGDLLVDEISTDEASLEINNQYLDLITKRAKSLISEDPKLKEPLEAYIKNQEEECVVLEECIHGALWVLQKK